MLAINASELGSTLALSTGVFHALSSGNGRRPWRLALMPRPGTPGLPGDVGIAGKSPERQAARARRAREGTRTSRMIVPIMTTETRTWIYLPIRTTAARQALARR